MFLQLPFRFSTNLVNTALILNTVLLIGALVVAELLYSDASKAKRRQLIYFLPIMIVLVGILAYAAFKQVGNS